MVTFAGQELYKIPGLLDPSLPVQQPVDTGTFLDLDDDQKARLHSATGSFAGGLLNPAGYQVRSEPVADGPFKGRYMTPLMPSGYVATEEGGGDPNAYQTPTPVEEGGNGAFTLMDLMKYESAMQGANFGNQNRSSVFESFKDAGGGTYDVDPGKGAYGSYFTMDGPGSTASFEDYRRPDGEAITRQARDQIIMARLGNIDESGGDGGF
jgi:hypothetical protein